MNKTAVTGIVSFVNHDKGIISIDYELNGKKKTITAPIAVPVSDTPARKTHHFQIGDTIRFTPELSVRGDRQIAGNIQFLYNTALEVLINKAQTDNRFTGYLKQTSDGYFVKEIDSYLFFPVPLSPWQIEPQEMALNEPVSFSLENTDQPNRISAKLVDNKYIPEFYTAVKLHKAKTPVEAEVYKVGPHGVYLNVVGEKMRSKIALTEQTGKLRAGDKIQVRITHIGTARIAVEPVL